MLSNSVAMKTNNQYEVRYCCPSCGDDGFHLYYNLKKNLFHCFKCGYKGRKAPEKNYTEEALVEMFDILNGKKEVDEAQHVPILPSCEPVRPGSLAMRYMLRRGIPIAKVSAMGCMISHDLKFENRIIIPVFDTEGTVVFYQARALLKSITPKYLNPITPKRGALFFNMGHAFPETLRHLYITEGIFKALRFWELNLPAVAIFGKEITKEQVKTIWSYTAHATICLDPDAFNFALKMMDQMEAMREWAQLGIVCPPKAADDMRASELHSFLQEVKGEVLR